MRSLTEWLYYLEHREQQEIQLGLSRIRTVANRLFLLENEAVVITVAGTNGKGSTVATLEAIYCDAGYRVGTYTSPHLLCFNERIRLNQHNISDSSLCSAFLIIEEARESIHLTYFEMATLAALWCFKQFQPDVIILEVGMGGRLDATNIVDSDLAVITTVDFDHEAYLGNTIEAIAFEKAGILRKNSKLIYADKRMPESIRQQAYLLNVTTSALNEDYHFEIDDETLTIRLASGEVLVFPKPQIHPHAAVAAILASRILAERLPVNRSSLDASIQNVNISGRLQVIHGIIPSIFDVSHNPQSVALLAERVQSFDICGKIHAVFSGLKDKDLCGLIEPLYPHVDCWYSAVLEGKRAASEVMLNDAFQSVFAKNNGSLLELQFYASITVAYQAAMDCAKEGDLIIVYGSFLVVSPVMLYCNGKIKGELCNGSKMKKINID